MTISEAKCNWNISYKTLCEYLERGFIPRVKIVDGIIIIPDNIKILVPALNATITSDNVVKYILKALNEFLYIDYHILLIHPEQFEAIMKRTEQNGYIYKISESADYKSTIGFAITEKGLKRMKSRNFGLGNLDFKLGFGYKAVYGEICGNISRRDN